MRAYAMVQQPLCHGRYCSLARTSCKLLFAARPPAARPPAGNPSPDAVRFKNPSKSMLAHDAVAAAVLYKHHPIIRVGAGLVQFVHGSRSHLANGGYQCVLLCFIKLILGNRYSPGASTCQRA